MLRFLSFLIFLAGAAVAAVGAISYFKIDVSEYLPASAKPVAERIVDYGEADAALEESAAPVEVAAPEPEPMIVGAAPEESAAPVAMEAPAQAPIVAHTPAPSLDTQPQAAPKSTPKTRSMARSIQVEPSEAVIALEEPILEFATEAAPAESAAPMPVGPTAEETFLKSLKTVPIAHQTPRQVEYMTPFDVVLAIDATGDDDATDSLSGNAIIVESQAQVSDTVEVRLIGAKFEIEGNSPMKQKLSPLTENTWRWSVTPLTTGEHDLVFEVFAIDQEAVTPLRTFRDRVTVQVSGLNKAIILVDQANPIFVLLGGIGSALGGLWGTLKFFGKK